MKMKKMINLSVVFAATACLAGTAVYRLEVTDEVPRIVGADGIRREVVILDPDDYAALTSKVERVWERMNADPQLRTKLHGKLVRQVIDAENREKHEYYEDGFVMNIKIDRIVEKSAIVPRRKISARQQMMRDRIKAKPSVKEVTVEHDATTGKETVR